jgi:hypothetical protein
VVVVVVATLFTSNNVVNMVLVEKKFPRQSLMVKFLKRAKASAPRPDGIPYAAWLASASDGAAALHLAMRVMMNGKRVPLGSTTRSASSSRKGPPTMTPFAVPKETLKIPDR